MTVKLSAEAREQLEWLLAYIETRWSERVRDNFILKLERTLEVIRTHPESYPASTKFPDLRKCVITPQTVAFYRVKTDCIEIATILDARQDW